MPRRSAESLTVVPVEVQGKPRLRPPEGLAAPVRDEFVELVSAHSPEHFVRGDMTLIVEFATAKVLARQAAEALLREGPVVAGRQSQWLVVQEKQVRALGMLALRLRVCPSARTDSRAAGRGARQEGPRGVEWLTGLKGKEDAEEE
jgi:hypothetical protein